MASGNDVVNFVARNGVYHSRMSSCIGRNVQFCCERYRLHLHDVLHPLSFDDMLSVSRPIDDMSLSYADVITELGMVSDGVQAFTDSHLSTADAYSFIEFLCTV